MQKALQKPGVETSFLAIFTVLLTARDEHAFDLLHWSVEAYLSELSKKQGVDLGVITDALLKSITNFFRASPSMVRYGACCCLHATVKAYPAIFQKSPTIISHIINGCLDDDHSTAGLYFSILEMYKLTDDVKAMIATIRKESSNTIDFDTRNSVAAGPLDKRVTVLDVISAVIKTTSPMPSASFQKLVNALEFLSKRQLLKQLQLIRLWAVKLEKVHEKIA